MLWYLALAASYLFLLIAAYLTADAFTDLDTFEVRDLDTPEDVEV